MKNKHVVVLDRKDIQWLEKVAPRYLKGWKHSSKRVVWALEQLREKLNGKNRQS